MNFAGRWVPMEVANAFLLLWLVEALIVLALFIYFRRSRRPPSESQSKICRQTRKQKTRRTKRR